VRGADGRARCADVIGKWATDAGKLAELAASFATAHPFPYVVIDDFFAPEVADRIDRRFPVPNGTLPEWQAQVRGRAGARSDGPPAPPPPHPLSGLPPAAIPGCQGCPADETSRRMCPRSPLAPRSSCVSPQGWHIYDNPIEGKLAHDNLEVSRPLRQIIVWVCALTSARRALGTRWGWRRPGLGRVEWVQMMANHDGACVCMCTHVHTHTRTHTHTHTHTHTRTHTHTHR
jgi:hypothetical protein